MSQRRRYHDAFLSLSSHEHLEVSLFPKLTTLSATFHFLSIPVVYWWLLCVFETSVFKVQLAFLYQNICSVNRIHVCLDSRLSSLDSRLSSLNRVKVNNQEIRRVVPIESYPLCCSHNERIRVRPLSEAAAH